MAKYGQPGWIEDHFEKIVVGALSIIIGLVTWGASQIYSHNRESGEIATDLKALKDGIADYKSEVKGTFDLVRTDATSLKSDVKETLASIRMDVKDGMSQAKGDAALAKAAIDDIKSSTKDIASSIADVRIKLSTAAKNTIWEELSRIKSSAQFGRFNESTKVPGVPSTYEWRLNEPVIGQRVLFVLAKPVEAIPGLEFSATISEDGRSCRMTVRGNNHDELKKLDAGVDAEVFVIAEPPNHPAVPR